MISLIALSAIEVLSAGRFPVGWMIALLLTFAATAGLWKIFQKAGQPGWKAAIPFYNMSVIIDLAGCPVRWNFYLMIPIVGFLYFVLTMIALARSFGKDAGFGIGCALLMFIYLPVLGFGSAAYRKPKPEGN